MYGADCLALTAKCIDRMQSTQGCVMKQVCGLSKRSHHSAVLQALTIRSSRDLINASTKSLFSRICRTDSPTRDICVYFMNLYITDNIIIPGSLIDRIVKSGTSPTSILLSKNVTETVHASSDGLVDSLNSLLFDENYLKPWSNEYVMVKLLTQSF